MADKGDNLTGGLGEQAETSRVVIDAAAESVFNQGVVRDILAPSEEVAEKTDIAPKREEESQQETEPDYGFGILGAPSRDASRSERIRKSRREAGIARDNEQLARLREENRESVERQLAEAEQMRRGIGELYSSIPEAGQENEALERTACDGEWEPSIPGITVDEQPLSAENESELSSAPKAESVEVAEPSGQPEAQEQIDYRITVGETVGADLLHIGGVTVAEIGVLADGSLTVSQHIDNSGRDRAQAPLESAISGNNLTRVTPSNDISSDNGVTKETSYDISSPYPDPVAAPRESYVESAAEEMERLESETPTSIRSTERLEREEELARQQAEQRGKPDPQPGTDAVFDTSSPYPEAYAETKSHSGEERGASDGTQRREELLRVLREAEDDEKRRRSQTSAIDPVVDMDRAAEIDSSGRPESKAEEPGADGYSFNKREASQRKARQTGADLEAVEARLLAELLELKTKNALYEFSYLRQLEDGAARKARIKLSNELKSAERRMRPARSYEIKDNDRFYRLTLIDISRDRLPSGADRTTLMALQTELCELLERRDELNRRLIELYRGSEGGKKEHAKGRVDADISGRRSEYRRLAKLNREVCSYRINLEDKKHIFILMDRRIVLSGEYERVRYILNREWPKGEYRKALVQEKKRIEQQMKENRRELDSLVKRVLTKAEKSRKSRIAMGFGWGIFILLVIGGALAYIFRDSIIAWLSGFLPGGQ